jgi:lipoprotein signal peptidase
VLVAAAIVLTRTHSRAVTIAGGVMAGGILGNALSASWNGLRVPDPIIATHGNAVLAFNLADIFTIVGTLSLTAAIAVVLIRNRSRLPGRAGVAARFRSHGPG